MYYNITDNCGYTIPYAEAVRFWNRVVIKSNDECWEYKAPGKGISKTFMIDYTVWRCSRLAFLLFNGYLNKDLLICHVCDNPPCCNPRHLFQGTHADNATDMKNKGRGKGKGPKGIPSKRAIRIRNIKTGEEYPSIRYAAKHMRKATRDIRRVLRGEKIYGIDVEIME